MGRLSLIEQLRQPPPQQTPEMHQAQKDARRRWWRPWRTRRGRLRPRRIGGNHAALSLADRHIKTEND
jgi:hypothetical protein